MDLKSYLTTAELRALKSVCRSRPISYDLARRLAATGYVRISGYKGQTMAVCEITALGDRYLALHRKNQRDHLWTRLLSIFATIISIASLTVSILSLLLEQQNPG